MRLLRLPLAALLVLGLAAVVSPPAEAASKCRRACDTTPPAVAVTKPTSGAAVAGSVSVTGTSSDNVALSSVAVSVDGGTWQPAAGTSAWSWTWNTSALADGAHTLSARATDTSGNVATASATVTVSNAPADSTAPTVSVSSPTAGSTVTGTVSVTGTATDDAGPARVEVQVDGGAWQTTAGTGSWSWSWNTAAVANGPHTLTARATDTSGNVSVASRAVTVSNTTSAGTCSTGTAPLRSAVTPEGTKIRICTSAGDWSTEAVHTMLKENSAATGDLSVLAPSLTVEVQDRYPSQISAVGVSAGGSYTGARATIYLNAAAGSGFANAPDAVLGHEYGHFWNYFHLYAAHQGDWSAYLGTRWTDADGATKLGQDSRLDSSATWSKAEIFADDYRLLFGSAKAISQRPSHLNLTIPDPRDQPGLADFLLSAWRTRA